VFGAALALTTAGCKQSEPRTGELFAAESRGLGYLERGQLSESEAQFKTVISLAPKEPLGYANLGLTYLRGSRYADAESRLRRARELDPTNADVGLMVAKLFAVTGRLPEAHGVLEQPTYRADQCTRAVCARRARWQNAQTDTVAAARYEDGYRPSAPSHQ
jgi:Tfp pilus assembly protein PilF